MKKNVLFLMLVAGSLLATACNSEVYTPSRGGSSFSFSSTTSKTDSTSSSVGNTSSESSVIGDSSSSIIGDSSSIGDSTSSQESKDSSSSIGGDSSESHDSTSIGDSSSHGGDSSESHDSTSQGGDSSESHDSTSQGGSSSESSDSTSQGGNSSESHGGDSSSSSGNDSSSSSSSDSSTPILTEVTTYLVLSSVGLYKGNPGTNVESLYLENTVTYVAKPGDPLPTKDDITVSSGSGVFKCWQCYEGAGAPTVYTTVPNENGKILYANFDNSGEIVTPPPGPGPTTTNIYLDVSGLSWAEDANAYFAAYVWNANGNTWYTSSKVSDKKYVFSIDLNTYTDVIFTRNDPSKQVSEAWGAVWNQTNDLKFVANKTTYKLTGESNGKMTGSWIS